MAENDMAKKIKELRLSRGMTLEQVADIVGVGKSTVRKWETGMIANMRRDKIASLAQALGTSPEYLMGWSNEIRVSNLFKIEAKDHRMILNTACDKSEDMRLYTEAGADINADFCIKMEDDSMTGARIFEGDIVFVRRQDDVNDGEIAAVLIGDKVTLGRVYYDREAGILSLFSENPKYKAMRFGENESCNVKILGKAIAFQSDIK